MYFIRITSLVVFLYVLDLKPFTKCGCKSEVTRVQDGEQIAWKLRKSTPSRQLSPVRGRQHLYYVVGHPVLECICELMLNWKRPEATVLLDGSISGQQKGFGNRGGPDKDVITSKFRDVGISVNLLDVTESAVTEIVAYISHFSLLNIVVLCNDSLTGEIVNQAGKLNVFGRNSLTWIISSTEWAKIFEFVVIQPQAQVTFITPSETEHEDKQLALFDVFYSASTNSTKAVRFARWSPSGRLQMYDVLDPPDREHKLFGRNILSIAFKQIPYAMIAGLTEKNETMLYGYMIELVEALCSTLNLRQIQRFTLDNFGIGMGGNYTGIMGILYRREADISIDVFAMTLSRIGACLFAACVAKGYMGVIYSKPKPYVPPSIYLFPFDVGVWTVAIGAIVVLMTVLALAWKAPWKTRLCLNDPGSRIIFSGDFLISVFADPRGLVTRIIFSTLIFTVFLLTAFYNSFLTSCLTYQAVSLPFDSLEELADNLDYTVLLVENTRHIEILENADEGAYAEIWKKAKKQPAKETFVKNLPEGLDKIDTGKYAFVAEGKALVSEISDDCNYVLMSRQYNKEFYYMTVRHDFPYSHIFKLWMIRAWEVGIIRKLATKYNLVEEQHRCVENVISLTLSLMQVMFVFFLWGLGIFLSLIILLVEIAIYPKAYTLRK